MLQYLLCASAAENKSFLVSSYLRNVEEGQGQGRHVKKKKADRRKTKTLVEGRTAYEITPREDIIHMSASHRV